MQISADARTGRDKHHSQIVPRRVNPASSLVASSDRALYAADTADILKPPNAAIPPELHNGQAVMPTACDDIFFCAAAGMRLIQQTI
jgi:hypothetical protein